MGARLFVNSDGDVLIGNVVTDYESGFVNVARSSHKFFNKVVGECHTHGTVPFYDGFSGKDLQNSNRIPVYLTAPDFGSSYTGHHFFKSYRDNTCTMSGHSRRYGAC